MTTTETARILVADDDNGVRLSVCEILAGCGYAVSEARDGDEALRALSSLDVEAVVLDVRMPGRDGISVVEDMLPEPPPPGILLVSAYEIDAQTRRRLGAKIWQVLRKPVPPALLLEAVKGAVGAARAARGN